ncbi:GNAT family protein [Fodinicola feengrottensis]|uniref:GNAT family protein n=1 Tax=Fodinicola feengrottensis TaxID=435914 RepID=A0ABP4U009_9ACTN
MIETKFFVRQPILTGERVVLEPLTIDHLDGEVAMLADPQVRRLTGTHQTFTEERIRKFLLTRPDQHDRADYAVLHQPDRAYLGSLALFDLDEENASMAYRIALGRTLPYGQGLGTQATRMIVDFAFDLVGLHRVHLEVYDFNRRAQRAYEKSGFGVEGRQRDALNWDGDWHDTISMAILATDPRPWHARPAETTRS